MRVALLRNPESGSGAAEQVANAIRGFGAEVMLFELDEVATAASSGADRIVVAGGDGSLGAAAEAALEAGIALAIVPVGTANDFARAMGIPRDLSEAARIAAFEGPIRDVEVGRMDGRPFLNVASVGLAPEAARRARGLKGLLGSAAYALGAARAGVATQPVSCRLSCDGETLCEGDVWQATVACSGAFGAGAQLDADPEDGLLDVVAVEAGSRARLIALAYALRRGGVKAQRGVRSARGRTVELEVPAETPFNVDGEVLRSGSARFHVDPRRVSVVTG